MLPAPHGCGKLRVLLEATVTWTHGSYMHVVCMCRSPDKRSREFLLRSDVLPGLVGHLASREEMPAEMAAEIIAELCNERRCR